MNSTSNAATIEYDNWMAGFHAAAIRNSDGSFTIWGENMAANGTGHFITPQPVNGTTYSIANGATNDLTGTVLKVAVASRNQAIILTTDGLFAVGSPATWRILPTTVKNTAPLSKLTAANFGAGNANSFGLPAGVDPGNVKMMYAGRSTLALTTCDGLVWVLTDNGPTGGNGNTGAANTWKQVKLNASTPLTNIIACRGNGYTMFALDANDSLWTWGRHIFLGNNAAGGTSNWAVKMNKPPLAPGEKIKMIGTTCYNSSFVAGDIRSSYYVLTTAGNLWALGNNAQQQLGIWNTSNQLEWVQPRYINSSGPVMNDVKWISPQEHYSEANSGSAEGSACINILTNDGKLYNWGFNRRGMLGRADTDNGSSIRGTFQNPDIPVSGSGTDAAAITITATDKWNGIETGGHTTMSIKACETQLVYAGHRINGSMGDNTSTGAIDNDKEQYFFTKLNTPSLTVCNAEAIVVIPPVSGICNGVPFTLNATPSGGTYTLLSGTATQAGATFTPGPDSDPITIQYTITGCNALSKDITIYKKDYGNLSSSVWCVASATIAGSDKVWLGGSSSTTGMATADTSTLENDEADGFAITGATSGNGTSTAPWKLTAGNTYSATVTVNGNGAAKPVYWAVWYDVNGNGSFIDAQDVFLTGNTTHGSPVNATVSLPVPLVPGGSTGAIRVAASGINTVYSKSMNGQLTLVNGEVEDYYVVYPSPLPVQLINFEAIRSEEDAIVSWTTGSVTGNNAISLEYSTDGINFNVLQSYTVFKNTAYSHLHKAPAKKLNYYRLKMSEHHVTTYSPLRMVRFDHEATKITVHPNPASQTLFVTGTIKGRSLRIVDLTGRELLSLVADQSSEELDIVKLPAGIYLLQEAQGEVVLQTVRFVKQ